MKRAHIFILVIGVIIFSIGVATIRYIKAPVVDDKRLVVKGVKDKIKLIHSLCDRLTSENLLFGEVYNCNDFTLHCNNTEFVEKVFEVIQEYNPSITHIDNKKEFVRTYSFRKNYLRMLRDPDGISSYLLSEFDVYENNKFYLSIALIQAGYDWLNWYEFDDFIDFVKAEDDSKSHRGCVSLLQNLYKSEPRLYDKSDKKLFEFIFYSICNDYKEYKEEGVYYVK